MELSKEYQTNLLKLKQHNLNINQKSLVDFINIISDKLIQSSNDIEIINKDKNIILFVVQEFCRITSNTFLCNSVNELINKKNLKKNQKDRIEQQIVKLMKNFENNYLLLKNGKMKGNYFLKLNNITNSNIINNNMNHIKTFY